ncbi:helix-turn-helix domain-containing protein [Nocardioides sp. zg-579]|uniref:Helix-turn-helix domain-containing protein n=1 Tax=Nocardioides marmotae TaxID=2663857 RepID=A0A6I3J7E2_9ACTN|nr:helix-turn-helix domain-containing protein [Gordonia jinghuaiqii]MTB93899.1 helix-turn-helix domain-containing protein [Nocardioides marmotae]QKE00220.1 helix-turn-helix domain-containing protein [Nocardioides marmotae]
MGPSARDGLRSVRRRAGRRVHVDKEFIQSLEKGLTVLRAFSRDTPSFTLAEMAKATGLSRAAARRVVLTLQSLGYVGTDGRQFFLLPKVLELGYAYLSASGLSTVAQPHLDALNVTLGEACSVGVLSDHDVIYVARAQGQRRMTTAMSIGTRLEATCTAVGRVLLAHLPDEELDAFLADAPFTPFTPHTVTSPDELRGLLAVVREQGWAVVDQELEIGFCTAAAPIRDAEDQVVGALNVGMHTARVPPEEVVDRVLPRLLDTAGAIGLKYRERRPA